MLEWADNNHLIPEGAVDLLKPVVVLCASKVSLDELWNLVHSIKKFHQASLFSHIDRCSNGKLLSHLVTWSEPSLDIISLTERENLCNITLVKNSSCH